MLTGQVPGAKKDSLPAKMQPVRPVKASNDPPLPWQTLRTKEISVVSDTLIRDTLSIIPASVQISDERGRLDSSRYTVYNQYIILKPADTAAIRGRKLKVVYRVFPFNLAQVHKRIDAGQIRRPSAAGGGVAIDFDYNPYDQSATTNIFENTGLEYNGAFSRGISVGNAQNLVLNSAFNLNLAGKIGDDIEILAAITDNNIPLQAEGNTRQLSEFDKIYIQIKKKNNTLLAGDYELTRPNSYFLNYYKKVQGATFTNLTEWKDLKSSLLTKAAFAIAKGKFARYTVPVAEGNQGPYRLIGAEGTSLIIVLAGTEKVYLDGQLLVRGQDADYVVDYNRGELTFTPRHLINQASRVIVEFEYSDQSYLRSIYALSAEWKTTQLRAHFNYYSEQDSKSSTGTQALDSLDKIALRDAGSNPDAAATSSITQPTDGFSANRIQYQQKDTVVNNRHYSVLVYSVNADSAKYLATFTPVGDGKGNYIQSTSVANGRVYQWVAPDAQGNPQGGFEPVKKLVAPSAQQMLTGGVDYQFSKHGKLSSEAAFSVFTPNLFAATPDRSSAGVAVFNQFSDFWDFGRRVQSPGQTQSGQALNLAPLQQPALGWRLQTDARLEVVQRDFRSFNPYRPAEFTRDWNIGSSTTSQTPPPALETLGAAAVGLSRKDSFKLRYEIAGFRRDTLYQGLRHAFTGAFIWQGFHLLADGTLLSTHTSDEQTQFFRPHVDLYKVLDSLGHLKIGVYAEREKNTRTDVSTDTFRANSFYYDLTRAYIELPSSKKTSAFGASYTRRVDYLPAQNQFRESSRSDEINLNGAWAVKSYSLLSWNTTYRTLQVADTIFARQTPQQTYLGRLEYSLNLFKNALYANTLYEIGSGQEQKIDYQYVKVQAGQGQFVWIPRHTGDTIPRLDEFEASPFPDKADYVRVTLYTSQYIRTNNVQFAQSLRLDPRNLWLQTHGYKKFLSRFATNSAVQINRRVRTGDPEVSQWNPFQNKIPDAALVAAISNIRNSLTFNRGDPTYDLEIGQSDARNRVALSDGYEEHGQTQYYFRLRWNITPHLNFLQTMTDGRQFSASKIYPTRNYDIQFIKTEPQLSWFVGSDLRFSLAYKYNNGVNILKEQGETARSHDFSLETAFNRSATMQIRSKISIINVAYQGDANTPVQFALLEGLQNGKNYLWNFSIERALQKNVQLSLNYEGRKTGDTGVVHVGRAQVRASF